MAADNTKNDSGPLTCTVCRCSSTWREAFTEIKDGTVKRRCCPACAQRLQTKWARITLFLMPIALALAVFANARSSRDPVPLMLLVGCLVLCSQYVLVLLHELGHAIAARLAGAPAYAIVIGSEPWVCDQNVGSIRWRMGYRMQGGLTYHAACEGAHARRNSILITAAGPLTNLAIAALALGWASTMPGRFLSGSIGKMALIVFGVMSALQFVLNAWPRSIKTTAGKIANDAARIVGLWRGELDDPRLSRCGELYHRALFAFKDRDFVLAEQAARRAQEHCDRPDVSAAIGVLRGAALCESGQVTEALALLQTLQQQPIDDVGIRAVADNNLAWAYLLLDEPVALERGVALVADACAIAPWETSFTISRACLLAASATSGNGRAEEARALVAGIRFWTSPRQNRAYAALARGLVACAAGDFATARREAVTAQSRGATAAPLRVLERRIASA